MLSAAGRFIRLLFWFCRLKGSFDASFSISVSFSSQGIWWFATLCNNLIFWSTEVLSCFVIFCHSVLWKMWLFFNFGLLIDKLREIFELVLLKGELLNSSIEICRVIGGCVESWALTDSASVHATVDGLVMGIFFISINVFELIFKYQDLLFEVG